MSESTQRESTQRESTQRESTQRESTRQGIWGEVARSVPAPRRRLLWGAILLTVLLHGAVFAVTYWVELSLESWSAKVAGRVHQDLARETEVDLTLPEPAAPEPAPPVVAKAEPPPVAPEARAERPETDTPPEREAPRAAPAEAAKTLVADSAGAADGPEDFSMAQGAGANYAGGVTTPEGTSKTAVRTREVESAGEPLERPAPSKKERVAEPLPPTPPPKPPAKVEGPDLSRPVGLVNPDWTCPWPKEADDEQIDTQTVLLRLTINAAGEVEGARTVKQPGHGFGPAALACARRTRFVAARDRSGQPARAEGALVRVQFSR